MKQISTPSSRRREEQFSSSQPGEPLSPSKTTIDFIKSFARACKPLHLNSNNFALSSIVIN